MWAQLVWPVQWELSGILTDITFLELFPVVVALNIWGYYQRNKKIIFHVDNQAVVYIINKKLSRSPRVMPRICVSRVQHLTEIGTYSRLFKFTS